jgi:outer membrane protein OmpU
MNKLTKYGLTALAGSLVATSVSAGELGVSGSWSWSYDSGDSDEVTGNPFSMGDSVTFSGSGETDQGWTAGVSYELDSGGASYDDYKLTLDMGDSGKLTYSGASVTGDGIHMVNDIVPAADTPVMSMTDSAVAYGVADGADAAGNIGYNITVGDIKASAEMQKGAGTDRTFGIQYTGVENMTLVYGQGDVNPGEVDGGQEETVWGIKYSVGGATLAYMQTEVDIGGAGAADEEAVHMGVSFAVNDDLTVSYAVQEVDITGKSLDEKNAGFGVSYTMGSMSVAAYAGKTTDGNGVQTADDEGKGVTLSIAF